MKAYKRLQAERDTLDETVKVLATQREPSDVSGNQSEDQEDGSPGGESQSDYIPWSKVLP